MSSLTCLIHPTHLLDFVCCRRIEPSDLMERLTSMNGYEDDSEYHRKQANDVTD
jgi:hypothetical protein